MEESNLIRREKNYSRKDITSGEEEECVAGTQRWEREKEREEESFETRFEHLIVTGRKELGLLREGEQGGWERGRGARRK